MNQNDYFKYLNTYIPKDIEYQKDIGNYDKAIELIDKKLNEKGLTESLKGSLIVQKEIINRLPLDYPYTFDEALKIVQEEASDFTKEEFQACLDDRVFTYIYVNGEIRILNRFLLVMKQNEWFRKRLKDYKPFDVENWDRCKTVKYIKEHKELAFNVKIKDKLSIYPNVYNPNDNYLVHLPFPKKNDKQSNIKLISATDNYVIDDENADQRCISWKSNDKDYFVEYSYTSSYKYVELDKPGIDKKYDFDVNEQYPHIVFTKFVKDTANEIVGDLKDPLEKARAIYDYITKNMRYSFQPNYFVMDNIVESCLKNLHGDCGIFAITFITLCRAVGIPAKWESCKWFGKDDISAHDWARFYVEPYGWLSADPSFGVSCNREGCEEGRQYYFGNLDPYRLVANSEFEKDFVVNKKYWRHDPYDNQLGEVENDQKGLIKNVEFDSSTELVSLEKI